MIIFPFTIALGVTGYFCADTQTEKSNNSAVNMLDVFILQSLIVNTSYFFPLTS